MVLHRPGSRIVRTDAATKALAGAHILGLCTSSALAQTSWRLRLGSLGRLVPQKNLGYLQPAVVSP